MELFTLLLPEIVLVATSLVLFIFGVIPAAGVRRAVPWVALGGVILSGVAAALVTGGGEGTTDFTGAVRADGFSAFVRVTVAVVAVPLVLLAWPTSRDGVGNAALHFGADAAEFFGLMLLSLAGVMLVSAANDTALLFMGIELASIPTYVLVAMSRPLPSAQEAGVKYFFLGAMAAAVLLMGFAYLYGVTGTTNLVDTGTAILTLPTTDAGTTWVTLALVLVVLGLSFKLAAFPLHFYAGDVYTGAATPVTALLSFVPKATGVIALVKVLLACGAASPNGLPPEVWQVLLVVAILTMTVGNTMALLTENLKRVMAYSSIAHSGYMLVAITGLAASGAVTYGETDAATLAAAAVLFYLVAYGVMNAGVFGVLMMLPTRRRIPDAEGNLFRPPATSAETYQEIRGIGRQRPALVAAMAVCCISLIGIPLTVGFLGKFYVFWPVVRLAQEATVDGARTAMWILVIATAINAAIAAGYYLRILSEMTLKPVPEDEVPAPAGAAGRRGPWPMVAAVAASAGGALLLGFFPPFISGLSGAAGDAATAVVELHDQIPLAPEVLSVTRAE